MNANLFRLIHLLQSRTGRIILALVLGASIFIGIGYYLRDLTDPGPPPDTLTVHLTWDQWADVQSCIIHTQVTVSNTLFYAHDLLKPERIAETEDLHSRLDETLDQVQTFALLNTSEPDTVIEAKVQNQIDRMKHTQALLSYLYGADLMAFGLDVDR